jgi:hypothetical protein
MPIEQGKDRDDVATVFTVDNGATPFMVKCARGVAHVHISKQAHDEAYFDDLEDVDRRDESHYSHLMDLAYETAFVGLDPKERVAASRAAGKKTVLHGLVARFRARALKSCWWCGGNSMLLRLKTAGPSKVLQYAFIGECIFKFTTDEEITDYVSTMGNSAVPYPYAVSASKTYLMLDRVVLRNADVDAAMSAGKKKKKKKYRDAYDVYYHTAMSGAEINVGPALSAAMKSYALKNRMRSVVVLRPRV